MARKGQREADLSKKAVTLPLLWSSAKDTRLCSRNMLTCARAATTAIHQWVQAWDKMCVFVSERQRCAFFCPSNWISVSESVILCRRCFFCWCTVSPPSCFSFLVWVSQNTYLQYLWTVFANESRSIYSIQQSCVYFDVYPPQSSRTIYQIYSILGCCIAGAPTACGNTFGAIWTHSIFINFKWTSQLALYRSGIGLQGSCLNKQANHGLLTGLHFCCQTLDN